MPSLRLRGLAFLLPLAIAIPHALLTHAQSRSTASRVSGSPTRINPLDVSVVFPAGYPAPSFEAKNRERVGRLLRVGAYKTSNGSVDRVTLDVPGFKQFLVTYSECPEDLGCSFSAEVDDLVSGQTSRGAALTSKRNALVSGLSSVEVTFRRAIGGKVFYFRHLLLSHRGYVIGLSVQAELEKDLKSTVVNAFFDSVSLPSQNSPLSLYKDLAHRFSISFPKGWTIKEGTSPDTVVKAVHKDSQGRLAMISIGAIKVKEAPDLCKMNPRELFAFGRTANPGLDMVLLDSGTVSINGKCAVWNKIDTRGPSLASSLGRKYFFIHNNTLFTVDAITDRDPSYYSRFEPILESSVNTLTFF